MAVKQDSVQVKLSIDGKQAGQTLNEMQKEVKNLSKELGRLSPNTEAFKNKLNELNAAKGKLSGVRDEINGVEKGLKGMLSSAKSSIAGMAPLGAAALGAFAVDQIVQFGVGSVKAFNEAANAAFQMRNAFVTLGGESEEALQRLMDQADALELSTYGASAEQIMGLQTQLKLFDLTAEEIELLTPKIMDYASVTGKDLATATGDVTNALLGKTKALTEVGIRLDKTSVSIGDVSDGLDKFKGSATAALDVGTNKFELLADRWGMVEETVGEGLVWLGNKLWEFGSAVVDAYQRVTAAGVALRYSLIEQWAQLSETASGVFAGLKEIITAPFTDGTVEGGYKKMQDALLRDTKPFGQKFADNFNKAMAEATKPDAGDAEIRKKIVDRVIPKATDDATVQAIENFANGSLAQLKKLLGDVNKQMEGTADAAQLATLVDQERTIKAGITAIEQQLADLRGENLSLKDLGMDFGLSDEEIDAMLATNAEFQEEITATDVAEAQHRQDLLTEAMASAAQTRTDIAQEEAEKQKQINQAIFEGVISVANEALSALSELSDRRAEKEIRNAEIVRDATVTQLDQQLKRREISQAAYDKRREAAEAALARRAEEARRKAARQQKAIALAQTIINTAEAVTKALASAPPPANFILAAAAGVMGGIQAGLIASQPIYRKGGVANGPSHEQGGIKMVNGQTGQVVGEMEGGEPYMILSRNTMRNNGPVINKLLESSTRRNGAPIFQTGGIFAPSAASAAAPGGSDSAVVAEVRALRQDMNRWQTLIRAYIVYDDQQKATDDVADIKAAAGR